jgi:rhodanese-related sulfurtransferase
MDAGNKSGHEEQAMFRSLFGQTASEQAAGKLPERNGIKQVDARGLQARLDAGEKLFLLDVRSAQEYAYDGHIAGSHLLPLPMLIPRAQELPADTPIICICRSGNRSMTAAEQLIHLGYDDVTNLAGGMRGWTAAGQAYE